jgi:hypothetical protein
VSAAALTARYADLPRETQARVKLLIAQQGRRPQRDAMHVMPAGQDLADAVRV